MTTYHVDGGASVGPPDYIFRDAYFTVCDEWGNLIHHEKIGDYFSGYAEWRGIAWAVENITERPIRISSDCQVAIGWTKNIRPKTLAKYPLYLLNLEGVTVFYEHNNLADQYNARYVSLKYDKAYYIERWKKTGRKSKTLQKLEQKGTSGSQELTLFPS